MVILGIDPGLLATGYGIIEDNAATLSLIAAGEICPPKTAPLGERLGVIHHTLTALIQRYHPQHLVLEQLFTHHAHVMTAVLMGHARGVVCLAAQEHGVPLAEYLPTQVKQSLTGSGHASKTQVASMVGDWLNQRALTLSADATDALGLAIVHAHLLRTPCPMPSASRAVRVGRKAPLMEVT